MHLTRLVFSGVGAGRGDGRGEGRVSRRSFGGGRGGRAEFCLYESKAVLVEAVLVGEFVDEVLVDTLL